MKKVFVFVVVVVGMIVLSIGVQVQDCIIKVGVVLLIFVDWGCLIVEVVQFVVDQVNEVGGVVGCFIEMVLCDMQVDFKVGVDVVKVFVDLEGVKVLFGVVFFGVFMLILILVIVLSGVMQMFCCLFLMVFIKFFEEGKMNGLWFCIFVMIGV